MQLSLLELEQRQMLSASVSLANGVLSVVADNRGDYIIVQQPTPQTVEVLVASEAGKTYDFAAGSVASITFQGGSGSFGDYFSNNTSLPSTQNAGANRGTNYLQGGSGNDTLLADPNPHGATYETDAGGTNSFVGGPGFTNFFAGKGTDSFALGSGYSALYSILAKNTITGHEDGRGYLIVNAGSQISDLPDYQIVTFFQPGVSGNAPGNPGGPSAVLQLDVNGNRILYLNAASGQATTSFTVNPDPAVATGIIVTYTDGNGTQTFRFHEISWIASFGPSGSNNTEINNTAINDVFYGGLPPGNHTLVGGFGINVLKGHSGQNTITARGAYNDISAGNGTDTIVDNRSRAAASIDAAFAGLGDVIRANQAAVSTTITGFRPKDVVVGVPLSINGQNDANDSDTVAADNDDFSFWAAFLRHRNSI